MTQSNSHNASIVQKTSYSNPSDPLDRWMYCDPLPYPCRAKRTFRLFVNNFQSKGVHNSWLAPPGNPKADGIHRVVEGSSSERVQDSSARVEDSNDRVVDILIEPKQEDKPPPVDFAAPPIFDFGEPRPEMVAKLAEEHEEILRELSPKPMLRPSQSLRRVSINSKDSEQQSISTLGVVTWTLSAVPILSKYRPGRRMSWPPSGWKCVTNPGDGTMPPLVYYITPAPAKVELRCFSDVFAWLKLFGAPHATVQVPRDAFEIATAKLIQLRVTQKTLIRQGNQALATGLDRRMAIVVSFVAIAAMH